MVVYRCMSVYICINDFLLQINSLSEVIMFPDDTSSVVFHSKYDDFMKVFNLL